MQDDRRHLLKRHTPVVRVRRMERKQFHKPLWLCLASFVVKKIVTSPLAAARICEAAWTVTVSVTANSEGKVDSLMSSEACTSMLVSSFGANPFAIC